MTDDQPRLFDKSVEQTVMESDKVECLGLTFPNDQAHRAFFLDKLREKLKEPAFRKLEGFPIGEDEDILALSDPPYYTACPNPFLEDFVTKYGRPYDHADAAYHCEPFAFDVTEGKQDAICMAHTYHTKVPYRAIVRYILHYTQPGDLVLDSFAGTGMSALAAQFCGSPDPTFKAQLEQDFADAGLGQPRWGVRNSVLFDLSPFATFLSRCFNSHLPAALFAVDAEMLLRESEREWGWVYETDVPKSRAKGTLQYALWVEFLVCECGREVALWHPQSTKSPYSFVPTISCPYCDARLSKGEASRAHTTFVDDLLRKAVTQNKQDLLLLEAEHNGTLFKKSPSAFDRQLLTKIAAQKFTHYVPFIPMMFDGQEWGDMHRTGYHFGVSHAHHFWTRRNLLVLSDLFARTFAASNRHEMLFCCTSFAVKTGSRMHNVGFKEGRINLAGQTYNTLQLTSISAERNLYVLAAGKKDDLSAVFGPKKDLKHVAISTSSATALRGVADNLIDYCFIDPPFGDNIMYSELSFLYEAWLRVYTNNDREAIISKKQAKELATYQELMLLAFREVYRVLKPGRWMTVAFHNSKNAVWNAIQEAMGEAGFVVADVRVLDKGQGTYKQMTTAGAVKQDLVISAYKPNGGLEERFRLSAGTEGGAWDFVRTHLDKLPIFVSKNGKAEAIAERLNYLLFDRMVAFHVQRGVSVPLSAGDFYAGLEQRFPSRDGMYFLPEQVAIYDKQRMTVTEVLQLELFVNDEATAIQWLRQQLTTKPQTFSELHPQFTREIGGWEKHEKPLELRSILDENFLFYDGKDAVPSQIHSYLSSNFKELRNLPKDHGSLRAKGKDRYYVADPKRASDLEKLRERSLLREFEEYRQSKQKKLKVFRLEAVRAGFKKAWDNRDYDTIISVAAMIPDAVLQEDQKLLMYYDQALMRKGG